MKVTKKVLNNVPYHRYKGIKDYIRSIKGYEKDMRVSDILEDIWINLDMLEEESEVITEYSQEKLLDREC